MSHPSHQPYRSPQLGRPQDGPRQHYLPSPPRLIERMVAVLVLGAVLTGCSSSISGQAVAAVAPATQTSAPTTPPATAYTAAEQAFLAAYPNYDPQAALKGGYAICTSLASGISRDVIIDQIANNANRVGYESANAILTAATTYLCPAQAAQGAAATPTGPATTVSDGTHQVGVDIAPGRYKTTGPDQSSIIPNCYWQRAENDSGEFSAIIANENLQGPGSVSVNAGEFVTFSGGCTWTKS